MESRRGAEVEGVRRVLMRTTEGKRELEYVSSVPRS
jgi:hypothetical protein